MRLEIKDLVDKNFPNKNQFAVAMGMGFNAANRLYNGKVTRIYFDTLQTLCQLLHCTPNDILISDDTK